MTKKNSWLNSCVSVHLSAFGKVVSTVLFRWFSETTWEAQLLPAMFVDAMKTVAIWNKEEHMSVGLKWDTLSAVKRRDICLTATGQEINGGLFLEWWLTKSTGIMIDCQTWVPIWPCGQGYSFRCAKKNMCWWRSGIIFVSSPVTATVGSPCLETHFRKKKGELKRA